MPVLVLVLHTIVSATAFLASVKKFGYVHIGVVIKGPHVLSYEHKSWYKVQVLEHSVGILTRLSEDI